VHNLIPNTTTEVIANEQKLVPWEARGKPIRIGPVNSAPSFLPGAGPGLEKVVFRESLAHTKGKREAFEKEYTLIMQRKFSQAN
jgi:hypothetical protein